MRCLAGSQSAFWSHCFRCFFLPPPARVRSRPAGRSAAIAVAGNRHIDASMIRSHFHAGADGQIRCGRARCGAQEPLRHRAVPGREDFAATAIAFWSRSSKIRRSSGSHSRATRRSRTRTSRKRCNRKPAGRSPRAWSTATSSASSSFTASTAISRCAVDPKTIARQGRARQSRVRDQGRRQARGAADPASPATAPIAANKLKGVIKTGETNRAELPASTTTSTMPTASRPTAISCAASISPTAMPTCACARPRATSRTRKASC